MIWNASKIERAFSLKIEEAHQSHAVVVQILNIARLSRWFTCSRRFTKLGSLRSIRTQVTNGVIHGKSHRDSSDLV